jgi:hypothetical protein
MAVLPTVRNIERVDEYCRVECDAVYPDRMFVNALKGRCMAVEEISSY